MANDDKRRIDRGSCLWCGHAPHDVACNQLIRVGKEGQKDVSARCTCKRHEWAASRSQNAPGADGTDSSEGR